MSDKIYTVYIHICPNDWIYVGVTGQAGRLWRKPSEYIKNCPKFGAAILEFGWKNIKHVVIGQFFDKREAQTMERELTRANLDHCYNIANTSTSSRSDYMFNYDTIRRIKP